MSSPDDANTSLYKQAKQIGCGKIVMGDSHVDDLQLIHKYDNILIIIK